MHSVAWGISMTARYADTRPPRLAGLAAAVVILALAGMIAPKSALAQGTAAQRDACEGDAISLCGEYIPNVAAIEACLKRKIKTLSPACRVVVGGTTWRKQKRSAAAQ
jgi:hypothetical protein